MKIKVAEYNKNSFIFFVITVFISFMFTIINAFNEDGLNSWISLFVFTILFIFSYLKFNTKKIFIFILYLYQYMFIFSCFVKIEHLSISNLIKDFFPFFVLPILCYIIILPSLFIEIPKNLNKINNKYTDAFIYFLFPLIVFSIIYLIPYTFDTFKNGAQMVRSEGQDNLPKNILTTLGVGISIMYPLYMFLLYYAIANKKNNKIVFITILGLLCGVVGGMVFATRDRIIYIIFYAILFNWLWSPYLKDNYFFFKVKKYIWVVFFIIISLFVWITLDRFSTDIGNIFSWTLFYYGAQPYIFADVVDKHVDFYGIGYIYPILLNPVEEFYRKDSYFWLWGTLYQNFYIAGGWFYCLFFAIFNLIFSSFVFKQLKSYKWIYIVYLILFYQIVVHGVFYYNLGFPGGNLYIIFMLLTGILMQFLISRNKKC
ncbi:O-antigen polymerase [Acinetobacter indicus]|uniref:O-antigen polymerase n=1 Tax=Acinetobacter indicus TaxID=756892 RepID=UPI001443E30F|nr:O-antigen polymerase [Acinetobacter indicus]